MRSNFDCPELGIFGTNRRVVLSVLRKKTTMPQAGVHVPSFTDPRILDGYPNDADNDVHALAFSPIVFEAPHTICLLIPERLSCRVHAPASNVRLSVCAGGSTVTGADVWLVGLDIGATLGLVES